MDDGYAICDAGPVSPIHEWPNQRFTCTNKLIRESHKPTKWGKGGMGAGGGGEREKTDMNNTRLLQFSSHPARTFNIDQIARRVYNKATANYCL